MKEYHELTPGEQALAHQHARLHVARLVVDHSKQLPISRDLKAKIDKLVRSTRRQAVKLGDETLVYRMIEDKLIPLIGKIVDKLVTLYRYAEPNDPIVLAGIVGHHSGDSHVRDEIPEPPAILGDLDSL